MDQELLAAAASWFVSMKTLESKYHNPTQYQRAAITAQRNKYRRMLSIGGFDIDKIEKMFERIWRSAIKS